MIFVPTEKRLDWQSPPIALIAIFILNILIFLFYQTGDDQKFMQAYDQYHSEKLIEIEWPAYQDYYRSKYGKTLPRLIDVEDSFLEQRVLLDQEFSKYLDENESLYILSRDLKSWRSSRENIDKLIQSVSSISLGLIPDRQNIITYFSYQFLHGGVMHLIGNMVFLLLFGFAVEAALGPLKFIAYYLISGVGSGLIFIGFNAFVGGDLSTPLIGASGSISGVMAMYVALFRLKKIEFFYWVFFFVGYFRAPALLLLPIYILYELVKLNLNEGSNIAYMGHVGGFLTGAVLILLTQAFVKNSINEEYLNDEVTIDPFLLGLDKVYKDIAAFQFKNAYKRNEALSKQFGNRNEIEELRLKLLKGLSKNAYEKFLFSRLKNANNLPEVTLAQLKFWLTLDDGLKKQVPVIQRVNLGVAELQLEQSTVALSIYKEIVSDDVNVSENAEHLSRLASSLGIFYRDQQRYDLSEKYMQLGNS